MSETPYGTVDREEMIARDHLATDRTLLANERTFLAYVRTALAFLITGVGAIKIFVSLAGLAAGSIFLLLAAATLVVGIWRFRTVNHRYHKLRLPGG